MGALESFILGALVFIAYRRVVQPTFEFRRRHKRRSNTLKN